MQRDDGSWVKTNVQFEIHEAFDVEDGKFVRRNTAHVGASHMSVRDVISMYDFFNELDTNGHGYLTATDLIHFMTLMVFCHLRSDQ